MRAGFVSMPMALPLAMALGTLTCLWSCTGDQEGELKEPVTDSVDTSTYPEDPDMAAGDEDVQGEGDMGSDEPVGELTDDPFGAPQSPGTMDDMGDDALTDVPADADDPLLPKKDGAYQDSFSNGGDIEAEEVPPPEAPEPILDDPVATPDDSGSYADEETPSAGKVTRYVDAILLNVRSGPSLRSPIVRRLLGGARIRVEAGLPGGFAKIKDGQYVREKYLSATPTRKVSRVEATRAWEKSKYKDTWKP